ncbi:PREDICTED: protoporphyrinogen oxidase-like isoform X2 [Priapulus caudatus]|nr:PREDICTED: protoporphyrinogen oxidase-like isoform X2 [Priapulus caudatus]
MVEDLGLSSKVLPVLTDHVASNNRFIYVDGKLAMLPTPKALFRSSPLLNQSLASMLWKELFTKSIKVEDETADSFITRRFSKKAAMYLADPMCQGVFAGKSTELSARSCFSDVFKAEQEYGSIVKGMFKSARLKKDSAKSQLGMLAKQQRWTMWSLQDGLQTLSDSLTDTLSESEHIMVQSQEPCTALGFQNGKIVVETPNLKIEANHVFSALPAKDISKLLYPNHQDLAQILGRIQSCTVGVVNLEYKGRPVKTEGFGYLIPSSEKAKILGVVFDSCAFPQLDRNDGEYSRFSCLMGGAWFEELYGNADSVDPNTLLDVAVESMRNHLGVTVNPVRSNVTINKNCIPQYYVGHHNIVSSSRQYITQNRLPISLLGASYDGASINDCIYNARKEVEAVVGVKNTS